MVQGHPRWMGHSEEFSQTVVPWRRKWQHTPKFLPGKLHEQYEEAKRYELEDEPPRLQGVQYTIGEEQKIITNSYSKAEAAGPKQE